MNKLLVAALALLAGLFLGATATLLAVGSDAPPEAPSVFATLAVSRPVLDPADAPADAEQIDALWRREIGTHAQQIGANTVLATAAAKLEVRQTAWYRSIDDPDRAVDELRGILRAEPIAGSALIRVAAVCRDEIDSKVLTQAVVDVYVHWLASQADGVRRQRIEVLRAALRRQQVEEQDLAAEIARLEAAGDNAGAERARVHLAAAAGRVEDLIGRVQEQTVSRLDPEAGAVRVVDRP